MQTRESRINTEQIDENFTSGPNNTKVRSPRQQILPVIKARNKPGLKASFEIEERDDDEEKESPRASVQMNQSARRD